VSGLVQVNCNHCHSSSSSSSSSHHTVCMAAVMTTTLQHKGLCSAVYALQAHEGVQCIALFHDQ